jgi:hypothetical protein
VVYKNKEGLCCSSRRLIGHQGVFARRQASGADVVQEPTEQPYGVRDCASAIPRAT